MSTSFSSSMRGGRTRKFKSDINVVPYIDVMLVLLVIFMVVAPMTNPGEIKLPSAEKSSLPPTEYIQISLMPNADAKIGINGQQQGAGSQETVTAENRIQRLRQLHEDNPELPLMIAADKDIKYDEVIKAISDAKKIGIGRVGLATSQ